MFIHFPKIKSAIKRRRFSDVSDIKRHVAGILKSIPEDKFQKCFERWQHRLTKCIVVQGHSGNFIVGPRSHKETSPMYFNRRICKN